MKRIGIFGLMLVGAALLGTAAEQGKPTGAKPPAKPEANPNICHVRHCIVTLIDDVNVPATEAGLVVDLKVHEGDLIRTGEPLAQLYKDDVEAKLRAATAELDVAVRQSQNEAEIEVARMAANVTEQEYRQNEFIRAKNPGAVSEFENRRSKFQWDQQLKKIDVARLELDVAKLSVNVKEAQAVVVRNEITRRRIVSPVDGIVVQVNRQVGEWVQPGDAVARVVRMNSLRVEGYVDADKYLPEDIAGRQVTVKVMLPRGKVVERVAKIGFVSPLVEASGDYRVWAEIRNDEAGGFWVIRPGLNAEMEIDLTKRVANR